MALSETIERILDVAENAIRSKGYHAVSFRDLADELGIKSASIHYHFRHKEDLGLALVERYANNFFAALEGQLLGGDEPETRLKSFVDQYRKALRDGNAICLCGLMGAEICGLPKALRTSVALFFNRNFEFVEAALPPSISLSERRKAAYALVSGLQGAMMLANGLNDVSIFDHAADRLLKDVLSASNA